MDTAACILLMCAIYKTCCAILKLCIGNLQISDLNLTLTLTLILTLAKLHSAFCKLCRLANCTQRNDHHKKNKVDRQESGKLANVK